MVSIRFHLPIHQSNSIFVEFVRFFREILERENFFFNSTIMFSFTLCYKFQCMSMTNFFYRFFFHSMRELKRFACFHRTKFSLLSLWNAFAVCIRHLNNSWPNFHFVYFNWVWLFACDKMLCKSIHINILLLFFFCVLSVTFSLALHFNRNVCLQNILILKWRYAQNRSTRAWKSH